MREPLTANSADRLTSTPTDAEEATAAAAAALLLLGALRREWRAMPDAETSPDD